MCLNIDKMNEIIPNEIQSTFSFFSKLQTHCDAASWAASPSMLRIEGGDSVEMLCINLMLQCLITN